MHVPHDPRASNARSTIDAGWGSPAVLCGVVGLALLLRLVAVFSIRWQASFDDAWYYRTAVDIAAGRGYLNDHGIPTAYFPVGYPGTLGAVFTVLGSSFRTAQLVNVVFSVATVVCVHALALQCRSSRRVAAVAAALFAFLPNQIVSCCVTMSEITFTFAVTLGILLVVRSFSGHSLSRSILAGAVFGWATLVRPPALLVPFVLIPVVGFVEDGRKLWRLDTLKRVVVVGLVMSAVVLPWTYRNYRALGAIVLVSSNGGENLLIGNNAASTQHYTAPATFYPKDLDIRAMPELERDELGAVMAKAWLKGHPLEAVLKMPRKIWYMYRSDLGVTNWIWDAHQQTGTPIYYLCQGLTEGAYLIVVVGGAIWLLRSGLRRPADIDSRLVSWVALSVIAYFTGVTMVFFGDARYHQPLMPLFAIAAASGFVAGTKRRLPAPRG